jgi:hypothetical protein
MRTGEARGTKERRSETRRTPKAPSPIGPNSLKSISYRERCAVATEGVGVSMPTLDNCACSLPATEGACCDGAVETGAEMNG